MTRKESARDQDGCFSLVNVHHELFEFINLDPYVWMASCTNITTVCLPSPILKEATGTGVVLSHTYCV